MSDVRFDIDATIATLILDNPSKLNALTVDMLLKLEAHIGTIECDPSIRVVLLRAEGDRAFCVGADIREWSQLSPRAFARDWIKRGHRVFDRMAHLQVPVIGVLQGPTFGGGLELAAACDLRVMAPHATLGLPETGVGIVPGWSGTQRLARLIPEAVLKEMALTGRRLTAERALGLGLINAVSEDPAAEATKMAEEIRSKAPQAPEVTKLMITAAYGEDAAQAVEALGGAVMAGSAEKAEGVASFLEKRTANFETPAP